VFGRAVRHGRGRDATRAKLGWYRPAGRAPTSANHVRAQDHPHRRARTSAQGRPRLNRRANNRHGRGRHAGQAPGSTGQFAAWAARHRRV